MKVEFTKYDDIRMIDPDFDFTASYFELNFTLTLDPKCLYLGILQSLILTKAGLDSLGTTWLHFWEYIKNILHLFRDILHSLKCVLSPLRCFLIQGETV